MSTKLEGSYGHYKFSMDIAKEHGIDAAVFLDNLAYWVKLNAANNINFHEGKYWSYNSLSAFSEIFPCWNKKQLETVIKNCIKNDLIIKGNHSKRKYDRTCWYTLTDKALKLFNLSYSPISQKGEMESAKRGNQKCKKGKSTITNIKPDIICASGNARSLLFDKFWSTYPKKKDRKRAEEVWFMKNLDKEFDKIFNDVETRKKADPKWKTKQFVNYPVNYLNNELWKQPLSCPSVVKEWGPGHPQWESLRAYKKPKSKPEYAHIT